MISPNNIKKNKGFTLIELLVVIGIITLLSSVILSSLTQAKDQANNTKQIADYKVVLNSLLQFKQDNGYYPSDNTNSYTCIGNYSGGCIVAGATYTNSLAMKNSLQKYLSSYNFLDKKVTIIDDIGLTSDFNGFVLSCLAANEFSQCKQASLLFPALKNKISCPQIMSDIPAGEILTPSSNYTWCQVNLN